MQSKKYNTYLYLISERQLPAESIFPYGLSSGGGLAVKVIHEILEDEKKSVPVPGGAVLMCPFVDYIQLKGSTKEYIKHDMIVNQESCSTGV
jgi:acetyl esterase/lipase